MYWTVLASLILMAADGLAQSARPSQGPVAITVSGPLVIGFFPPYSKEEEGSDAVIEGLAHVRFALEDIAKCFQNKDAAYRLDVTRRFTLRDGQTVRNLGIPSDWGHSVGLVFATPGRAPHVVYATDGPGSLVETGRSQAAEYFGAPVCRKSR
jgi:hypothetical protein